MKTLETILLGLMAWCFISAIAALVVGRIIAVGQGPHADRLAEVEADRLVDEAHEDHGLFV